MERVLATSRARGVMAALATAFNFLLLNALVVLACIPVVTAPLAIRSAWIALVRWREEGEDRVALEFWTAFRGSALSRSTLVVGGPLVLLGVGVVEIRHFASDRSAMGFVCLGLAFATAFLAVGSVGYVVALDCRSSSRTAGEIWTRAIHLALRNAATTGLVATASVLLAAGIASLDPATLVLGLPLAALWSVRRATAWGLRRSGIDAERS